jgi:predicted pyridoxine 5'-phosphate oxidase superfamily flavin-nucleotide-binding protein
MSPDHRAFIEAQKIFFVASAAGDSRVNVSPKSTDELRIVDEKTALYRDLTGSGNETAAHAAAGGGVTFMFCAFDGPPNIVRLYGHARIYRHSTSQYDALHAKHFAGPERIGSRQIIVLDVELVQASCGYAVPQFDYVAERPILDKWARDRGPLRLSLYRKKENAQSIDGLPAPR